MPVSCHIKSHPSLSRILLPSLFVFFLIVYYYYLFKSVYLSFSPFSQFLDYSPPQISNDMASQRNIKAHYKKILERQKVVLLSVITSDDNANESDDEFDDYDYNNQQEDSNRSSTTVISI